MKVCERRYHSSWMRVNGYSPLCRLGMWMAAHGAKLQEAPRSLLVAAAANVTARLPGVAAREPTRRHRKHFTWLLGWELRILEAIGLQDARIPGILGTHEPGMRPGTMSPPGNSPSRCTRPKMVRASRQDCPYCATTCDRESVDVGVGVIYGPWGCSNCGWSEYPEYDSRDGILRDGEARVFDQYGVSHSVDRMDGADVLAGLNVINRGRTCC